MTMPAKAKFTTETGVFTVASLPQLSFVIRRSAVYFYCSRFLPPCSIQPLAIGL